MQITTANNRQTPRVKLQIPVRLTSKKTSDTSFHISSITELSPQGAFISTSTSYPTGTRVNVQFDLPAPQTPQPKVIHALAEVAWCGEPKGMGMGLRFIQLTDEEKEVLTWFVQRQSPVGNA